MNTVGNPKPQSAPKKATVSGRWLLGALALTLSTAVFCTWLALCLAFWWGSWQFLYQPAASITQTPANAGLAFDAIGFAADETGSPRLRGWWIPASPDARFSRLTVLYLHSLNGNLSNTVNALAQLHAAGVNVLAFDYRGYGQSQFARPSEARWREDAEWALHYLADTRHVATGSTLIEGSGMGANLALEVADAHPDLAGVIVESPVEKPMAAAFSDAPHRLIPVRLLMRDRFDLDTAATKVRVPVLWIGMDWGPANPFSKPGPAQQIPEAYMKIAANKTLAWVNPVNGFDRQVEDALTRWLDNIHE